MSSPMRGGFSFRPFPLLKREVISRPGASYDVVLLTFGLPRDDAALGVSQPTTHVKARLPGSRGRTYSIVSPASARGHFCISVKVRPPPEGALSPRLAALEPGDVALFARTLTKRLAAPLDGTPAAGRRLAVAVFGIGVAEAVITVRRALRAGQAVALLVAARASADLVFVRELCEAAAEAAAAAAAAAGAPPPLRLRFLLSREPPPAAFSRELDELCGGAAAACGVSAEQGRIDAASVAAAVGAPEWRDAAALAVGTKQQAREAYALLAAAGVRRKLLGKPVLWGCW